MKQRWPVARSVWKRMRIVPSACPRIILTLILAISAATSIVWIQTCSGELHTEDMLVLDHAILLYEQTKAGTLTFSEVYFSPHQQLPSLIHAVALTVLPCERTPLYVNVLVVMVTGLLVFGIADRVYGPTAALLATFVALACPGLIGFSRTVYAACILSGLLAGTVLIQLKTERFGNRWWSICWGFLAGVTLLAKYTMLPYVGAAWAAGLVIVVDTVKHAAAFGRPTQRILNFAIGTGLMLGVATPHYLQEWSLHFALSNYSAESFSRSGIICDLATYPLFQVKHQLGLVLFLFVVIATVEVFVCFARSGRKGLHEGEFLMLIVLALPFFAFSLLVGLKNDVVSGLAVPVMAVLIAGMVLSRPNWMRRAFAGILVANGLYFLLPIEIPQPKMRMEGLAALGNPLPCGDSNLRLISGEYRLVQKEAQVHFRNEPLLTFRPKNRRFGEFYKLAGDLSPGTAVLDLSASNNAQLAFYSAVPTRTNAFRYLPCPEFIKGWEREGIRKSEAKIGLILLSDRTYREAYSRSPHHHLFQKPAECDDLRRAVIGSNLTEQLGHISGQFGEPMEILRPMVGLWGSVSLTPEYNQITDRTSASAVVP